jgi:hypothetical protein
MASSMPFFTVEAHDGRAFRVEAEDAEAALQEIVTSKRLARRQLTVQPPIRHEREWGWRLFVLIFGAFIALGLILSLL